MVQAGWRKYIIRLEDALRVYPHPSSSLLYFVVILFFVFFFKFLCIVL